MSEVVTLLSSGEGRNEKRDVRIEILPIEPETSLSKVEDLLRIAADKGSAARKLNDCLYVEAFDSRKLTTNDFDSCTRPIRQSVVGEWEKAGDTIHDLNTLDLIAYSPNCAPFSVFPFRARTCIDLLIGAQFYVTFLNMSAVAREFERRGWEIVKDFRTLHNEGEKDAILHIKKGGCWIHVPPSEFMRLQTETLRPKTIIDSYEAKYRQGPIAEQCFLLSIYDGESRIWN